jgi:hypothetical protein
MAITTKAVPVEAHWSIGIVEKYHEILRRAYSIVATELEATTRADKDLALQMAVKAVNDTAGPNGLVPTLLAFGAFPRLTTFDAPTPTIAQRSIALAKAMKEVRETRARLQVQQALQHRNGPNVSALHDLPLNSQVLVWREGVGNQGSWKGPFELLHIQGETCKVQLPSGPTDFRTTQVKPYNSEPDESNSSPDNPSPDNSSPTSDDDEPDDEPTEPIESEPRRGTRIRRPSPKARSDITLFIQGQEESALEPALEPALPNGASALPNTMEIEIFQCNTPPYTESRRKEINGLLEKGVFAVAKASDIPQGTRIFKSRFVDEIKHPGTEKAFEKSRLVVQAYNDHGKGLVLTQSPTIQRMSQRLILALTPTLRAKGINLYLRDISQAYVQSTTELNRQFFIYPPPELEMPEGSILKVIKPLYGVPEAGNHWFNTYHKHHTNKLHMIQSTYDPCLLHTRINGFGVVGLQTDDTLFLADDIFALSEQKELEKAGFLAKERETLTNNTLIKFNGGIVTTSVSDSSHGKYSIKLSQDQLCKTLNTVKTSSANLTSSRGVVRQGVTPKDQYIAQRARGAYIASVCQPEASFELSFAAQVINPKEQDAKALNRRLQWQIDNHARGLKFVELDINTLKWVVFTDASFANLNDNTSQIGFVVTLADKYDNANIVHWSSIKCKRVTRSVLASELYGITHGFDIGVVLKSTLEAVLDQAIPLVICTDSKSLYDCLVKLGSTQEKRLMIDVMCLRQSYERRQITEIKWIDGGSNPADAMTKSKSCQALTDLIDNNKITWSVTGWVEREKAKDQGREQGK